MALLTLFVLSIVLGKVGSLTTNFRRCCCCHWYSAVALVVVVGRVSGLLQRTVPVRASQAPRLRAATAELTLTSDRRKTERKADGAGFQAPRLDHHVDVRR